MTISQNEVMQYIAQCAESIIEDDMNEDGDYTEEEHEELVNRAMQWCSQQYALED